MNKYRNIKTVVDGHLFDSRREATRYAVLKQLEKQGDIQNLTLQPRFMLKVNDVKVADYVGDFAYIEKGVGVVEDVKGMKTPVYQLKKKLMKAIHGIEVRET